MPAYQVEIQEVYRQVHTVEADSAEEAAKRAANAHWDPTGIEWTFDDLEYDHTPGDQTVTVTDEDGIEEEVNLPRTE
jgi:hypothetical protein